MRGLIVLEFPIAKAVKKGIFLARRSLAVLCELNHAGLKRPTVHVHGICHDFGVRNRLDHRSRTCNDVSGCERARLCGAAFIVGNEKT